MCELGEGRGAKAPSVSKISESFLALMLLITATALYFLIVLIFSIVFTFFVYSFTVLLQLECVFIPVLTLTHSIIV